MTAAYQTEDPRRVGPRPGKVSSALRKSRKRTAEGRIRKLRCGDILRLVRWRYGPELPDDDAGREDLYELLLPTSLDPDPDRRMINTIEIMAPWMDAAERFDLMAAIKRTPAHLRKVSEEALGERMNLANQEREFLRLWTITPVDMTREQLEAQRAAKERARKSRYRAKIGRATRDEYLKANSASRDKPWVKEGISRAQWYRRKKVRQVGDASISEIGRLRPVSPSKPKVRERVGRAGDGQSPRAQPLNQSKRRVSKGTVTNATDCLASPASVKRRRAAA